MRPLVIATVLIATACPSLAQPASEQAAAIIQEVCVLPTLSKDVMTAGERRAAASGWSLDIKQSGQKPGLVHSVEEAKAIAPIWTTKTWNFDAQNPRAGTLAVWIVGPDYPEQRVNTCQVSLPGKVSSEVVSILRAKLSLGDMTTKFWGTPSWILSGDPTKPDDGVRWLVATEQKLEVTKRDPAQPYGATLPGVTEDVSTIAVIDIKSFHGAFPPGSFP